MFSVGLDFGTSNSSVAVYDGASMRMAPLDPDADEPAVLRSLLYLTRTGERYAGKVAMDRYLAENLGRPVRLERRFVGDVTMTFGGVGTITTEAHAVVDANEPGRLFQSIKTLLPDRLFKKTSLFGVDLTIHDLIVLLAGEIIRRTEAFLGQPVRRLTVGRPVHFSANPAADDLARERLREAVGRLGIDEFDFLEEPVAAALSYVHRRSEAAVDGPVLVFDFGGGTLDVTVVRVTNGDMQVLSTGGVSVGGDLLDRRIVDARMLRHFGEGATYSSAHLPVPRHILARLLDWQTAFLLNRPDTLGLIDQMVASGSRPQDLMNLRTLVTRNYGSSLFRAVEEGKQRLSAETCTSIALVRDDIDVRETLTREEFEGIIREQFNAVETCVRDTAQRAGVADDAIRAVVTTGGSSRIPLFRRGLAERFPRAKLIEQDAFTSVAAGLAYAGYQG
ncbi:MAG: Hsp70 family protein [Dehalococcoidia bacterium]